MLAPTILFVLGHLWNTILVGVQGMVPMPWFDSRAPLIPGPFRASVPGRMAPVGFGCAGRRRVASKVLTYLGQRDAGSESEVGLGAGLPIGEAVRRRLEPESSTPVG